MHKKFILSSAVVGALFLTACGSSGDSGGSTGEAAGAPTEGGISADASICFATPAESHPYVTPFNENIRESAAQAGIGLTVLSSEFDVQTSAEQLNQCVAQAPDVVVLWPIDASAYIPGLTRAKQAGIPVVQVNSPMNDEASALVATFTGPDNYIQGEGSAKAMAEALPEGGKIVVIAGQAGNGTTIGRSDGFTDTLPGVGPNIEVLETVYADFDKQTALTASRDLITRFGDEIDGVYAQDDLMAAGWVDAYASSGQTKKVVVIGISGTEEAFKMIEAGTMYATLLQSPVDDANLAWGAIAAILKGEEVESRIPLENVVIKADNIADFEPAF